jgi:NADPH-dependent glutamate synthase beta subunit-like oxidoreductase
MAVLAVVVALGSPSAIRAHEGHAHKVLGTVSAVTANQLDVKTTDGKSVAIALDAKTIYRQGKAKADRTILKIGERVVVDAIQPEGAKTMTATTVQMAAPPTAAKR